MNCTNAGDPERWYRRGLESTYIDPQLLAQLAVTEAEDTHDKPGRICTRVRSVKSTQQGGRLKRDVGLHALRVWKELKLGNKAILPQQADGGITYLYIEFEHHKPLQETFGLALSSFIATASEQFHDCNGTYRKDSLLRLNIKKINRYLILTRSINQNVGVNNDVIRDQAATPLFVVREPNHSHWSYLRDQPTYR